MPRHLVGAVPWVTAYGSVALLLVVIVAYHSAATYKPLAFIGGAAGLHGLPSADLPAGTIRGSTPGGDPYWKVPYTPNESFVMGFHVRNRGRFGVTVTHISNPLSPYVHLVDIRIGKGEYLGTPQAMQPFRSFALAPQHSRWVEFRYTFLPCPSETADGFIYVSERVPIPYLRKSGQERLHCVRSGREVEA